MRTAALSLMITMAVMLIASANATAQIPWQDNLRSAHAQAEREGKLMLLHFYSDNCTWCDRLEAGSFQAPQVGQTIDQNFVPVKIHANSTPKLAEMFKVTKFPTDVIVTTDGKTLSHAVSPQEPDRYVAMLTKTLPALGAAKKPAPATEAVASQIATPSPQSTSQVPQSTSQFAPPQSAPSYAASANPDTAVSPPSTADSEFSLPPSAPFKEGVKAQLAASRSEGFSLEMPAQSAAAQAEPATASIEDVTPDASPKFAATKPASPSTASFKPEQAELAMQGFCPVTVITQDKWVEGNPAFGAVHLGKLYLFSSEENLKTFLADPIPYTPVLNEIDVVRFFEERKIVPGKREWGLKDPIYNRMFFFADEAAMNHFYNEYERYTDAAIEVMEKAVKDANPGT